MMNRWAFTLVASLTCLCTTTWLQTNTQAEPQKGRFYFERQGLGYWQIPIHEKAVALTFDDGPNRTFTPQILRLLQMYHNHATFFVVGNRSESHAQILRQEIQDGNEIGNHTFSHRPIQTMSQEELEDEIEKSNELIEQITHKSPTLFRPPLGYYDEKVMHAARDEGCKVVIWSWDQDSRDWQSPSATSIAHSVLTHLHPGDIILMHDNGGNRTNTVNALKIILPQLKQMGYRAETVSELISIQHRELLGKRIVFKTPSNLENQK
jgi:peptidoglycan-N-acetylglucosamine deacetylase